MERFPVIVIGAGPAGLAASHELSQEGIEHVVLERDQVAASWRARWDSFCLVTPNWTVLLPGGTYEGDDPDGFLPRDEIVKHFERYAQRFDAPIRTGVEVTSLRPDGDGGFLLATNQGPMSSREVIVANGAFQESHRPADTGLPSTMLVIDSTGYRNPSQLPDGGVLVVGSGQTGCQIADELHRAGRRVAVACGKAPWVPRRLEGRDIVAWVADTPFLEQRPADLPSPMARLAANFQTTGRDGGQDLHYRTLQASGITLVGRFLGGGTDSVRFADDLPASVAFGDARYADVRTLIEKHAAEQGAKPPEMPPPDPFATETITELPVRDFGTVIFTAGFRPMYRSWIEPSDAFDELGFPITHEGMSTVVPGMSFVGAHFLRKRKSSTLLGMGEDAGIVASRIASRL